MKLSEYLLDRIFSLICMLVAALVLLALLWLIETPAVFILFAEVILLAAYSIAPVSYTHLNHCTTYSFVSFG